MSDPEQFGDFHILRELGQGTMGRVDLAEHPNFDGQIALKRPHVVGDVRISKRFDREATLTQELQHPNICPIFDAGEIAGQPYIAMKYIAGKSLEDYIHDLPEVSEIRALKIARDIADAMATAHEQQVVHRDLKPSNVLLDENLQPYLVDFGLALALSEGQERLSLDGEKLGTPAYMSPEQVSGDSEAIGPHTDVYGLGATLFELLTKRLPYVGNFGEVFMKIIGDDPPPLVSAFRSGLHRDIDDVVAALMAKDPSHRIASMASVAAMLGEILDELGGNDDVEDRVADEVTGDDSSTEEAAEPAEEVTSEPTSKPTSEPTNFLQTIEDFDPEAIERLLQKEENPHTGKPGIDSDGKFRLPVAQPPISLPTPAPLMAQSVGKVEAESKPSVSSSEIQSLHSETKGGSRTRSVWLLVSIVLVLSVMLAAVIGLASWWWL